MRFKVLDSLGIEKEIIGIAKRNLRESEILILEDITPNIVFYVVGKKALIYARGLLAHITIVALEFNVPVVRVSKEDLSKMIELLNQKGELKLKINKEFVEILP